MVKTTGGLGDEVRNKPTGGSGGTPFTLTDEGSVVTKLEVWIDKGSGQWSDRYLVKGIEVTWDDKSLSVGNTTSSTTYSHDFKDSEKVQSMVFWTGDRVDRILFVTNQGRTFAHGGDGGTPQKQDVGNGNLLGFEGSSDSDELISIGSDFETD